MPTLINGRKIIGGFEDTFEAGFELFRDISGKNEESENKQTQAQPENAKEAQEQKKAMAAKGEIWFNKQVAAEVAVAQNVEASKPTIEMQRTKINTLLNLQEAYQGSVDAQGNITKYHQAEAEKKEAETSGSGIQAGREQKKAQSGSSGSFEMGENELGLGGENKNHFTTAVG